MQSRSMLDRRAFFKIGTFAATTCSLPGVTLPVRADLALGAAALPLDHFPSRVHAFVWRNWGLVPLSKIAATISATQEQVAQLGSQMGLPHSPDVPAGQWDRSYLTIIRRNWHLLPEEQLLELMGWDTAKLEFTLNEDDFFFVKLGSQKPRCEPIRYADLETMDATKLMRFEQLLKRAIPDGMPSRPMNYFQFVNELSLPLADKSGKEKPAASFKPTIAYPYFALFGDPLMSSDSESYPDGYLDRLANSGVDSIWMHIVLNKLAPFPWDQSISEHWQQRLESLQSLTQRASKHGIGVYLYLNEPRHPDSKFFDRYPELKGQGTSLCTSVAQVQDYIKSSIELIVERAPMLAGFFSITASENPTHCWSHFKGDQCPRCSTRGPGNVIADLNNLYLAGIEQGFVANSTQHTKPRLIVWDWGWADGWAEEIIPRLNKGNIALMSVSEWDLPIERVGVASKVGEYSISAIGPGPRAKRHWDLARQNGIDVFAKIQANNSWEIGAVPFIPAMHNVAQHLQNLRNEGVSGLMLGWSLGGCPSANLDLVSTMSHQPHLSVDQAIESVAVALGGPAHSALVTAWGEFSGLFSQFPYHVSVVYSAPLQCGSANLLYASKTNMNATMVGLPYDDLESWRSIYPPAAFINVMRDMGQGFEQTALKLRSSCQNLDLNNQQQQAVDSQTNVMETIGNHYQSIANQAEFITLRDVNSPESSLRIKQILQKEQALALRMAALQYADSRLGYEASNHYFYVPADLYEKALNCQHLLDHWLPLR